MKTWITLSIVALLPMLLRTPKALSPLRVNARDPSRLSGLFRRYAIDSFTGRASDSDKRSDSYTKGSSSAQTTTATGVDGHYPSISTTMSTSIDTQVVVTDRFFLTDAEGQVLAFESRDFEARVGNGHTVSVAWVVRGFGRRRRNFLIWNHTTGELFFSDREIHATLTFPYPGFYLGILCLMILPIPVVLFFWLAGVLQEARFTRAGIKPLMDVLREAAAGSASATAAPTADLSTSLEQLTGLRDAGALTEAEFEQAKARLLGSGSETP